jgi:soluble lytic murein transglycosylase
MHSRTSRDAERPNERRTFGRALVLMVLAALSFAANGPAQPPETDIVPSTPVAETVSGTGQWNEALGPTRHDPIPITLEQAWLVPTQSAVGGSAALRAFAGGVEQFAQGNYAQALLLVSDSRLETTPITAYASYYTALCYLRLSRPAEARTVLNGLRSRPLEGFLREAAPLAEADAAQAAGDYAAAARILDELKARPTAAPDMLLDRLARAAAAAGDMLGARAAILALYNDYPDSVLAQAYEGDVAKLRDEASGAARDEFFKKDLARAEKLFSARRYADARAAFANLRGSASGDDAELVGIRLGECDYFERRYRQALDGLAQYEDGASRRAEARFFIASATRAMGLDEEYVSRVRQLAAEFPDSTWAADALDGLASFYILANDDASAADVFALVFERFASSRRFERAAWKLGWWRYRNGDYQAAASVFERAAAQAPRSDHRPAWVYWAGRARDQISDRTQANARFELVTVDYLNSYYGRMAATILEARGLEPGRLSSLADRSLGRADGRGGGDDEGDVPRTGPVPPQTAASSGPPNGDIIRTLLSVQLYDLANDELQYARRVWGRSSQLDATLAWVYGRQGDLRRGINAMKQAYPQYIASGGEELPADVLRVIFPLDYWDIIRRHAAARDLDPYLVVALVAQESSFSPAVRSPANAWGLMQLLPSTGRRLARAERVRRYSTAMLTNPEVNVRLGTRHLASLVDRFGGVHYALASYNAGEQRIVRWKAERPGLDRDEFIDDIPFPETQTYVKKILGTAEDYRRLYGSGRLTAAGGAGVARTSAASGKSGSRSLQAKGKDKPAGRKAPAKSRKRPTAPR